MIPIKDDIPSRTFPYVTVAIIIVNVLVFLYELSIGPRALELFIYRTAAVPIEVVNFVDLIPRSVVPPPFTVFTAMFVHGGFLHLAGNMLFLWIFGDNVEDTFGHWRFFLFYLGTGLVASLAHVLSDVSSITPMLGASGAVAGVLGAYFLLFPRANVLTLVFLFFFVTFVRIPALVFLGLWFAFQVLSSGAAAGGGGGGGIAWFAHIGGFVAGAAGVLLFAPGALKGRFTGHR
jgi:membrane associated rhomboid family serine protease